MKLKDKLKIKIKTIFILLLIVLAAMPLTNAKCVTTINVQPGIFALCPNPYGSDNSEWVAVYLKAPATFTDGEGKINLSQGIYVLTKNVSAFNRDFKLYFKLNGNGNASYKVLKFPKRLALSNSGEKLWIYSKKEIYNVTYKRVPEGVILEKNGKNWTFFYQDWTFFKPVSVNTSYTIYITPCDFVFKGDKVKLASYTFTQANVKFNRLDMYLDAHPVGGIPKYELCFAHKKNVSVHFLASKSYRNFHYKFAISGNKVVITTENWKWDKRGYIVEFKSEKAAQLLNKVLRHDLKYSVSLNSNLNFKCEMYKEKPKAYSKTRESEFYGEITVFVLPDYNPIINAIANAKKRVYIEVPYIISDWKSYVGKNPNPNPKPIISALKKASRNGAEVKIILAKYKTNKEFLKEVKELKSEGINISTKCSNFPLHGKLIIVDNEAIITSANMDMYGLKKNREIGVILHGEAVNWLAKSFLDDWNGKFNSDVDVEVVEVLVIASILLFAALLMAYKTFGR